MGTLGPLLSVLIMEVSLFSRVLINRFHCISNFLFLNIHYCANKQNGISVFSKPNVRTNQNFFKILKHEEAENICNKFYRDLVTAFTYSSIIDDHCIGISLESAQNSPELLLQNFSLYCHSHFFAVPFDFTYWPF